MKRTILQILALFLLIPALPLAAQDSVFTYQGQLKQSGSPYTGNVAMDFSLWQGPDNSLPVGSTVSRNVPVTQGLFQAELDFGNVFGPEPLWLQIEVDGQALNPRQRLTPAPVALYALSAPGGGGGSHWTLSGGELSYSGPVAIGSDPEETSLSVTGALHAETNSIFSSTAISGVASGGGHGIGVHGTGSGSGSGVVGTGGTEGVAGFTTSGTGVLGQASGTSGPNQGVLGFSSSLDGYGVRGRNLHEWGTGVKGEGGLVGVQAEGVIGVQSVGDEIGGYFFVDEGTGYGLIGFGPSGVYGFSSDPEGYGALFTGIEGSRNYFQREVGIGTDQPEAMLHIEDTTGDANPLLLRISDGTDNKFSVSSDFILFEPGMLGSSLYLNDFVSGGQTVVCKQTSTGNAEVGYLAQCSSSARYKEDIADLDEAAALIAGLRAVSYRWIAGGAADLGLVAEEVAEIEPRLVTYNNDGEVEGVKYDRLAAVLVRAFQDEQAANRETVAKLNARNHALQAELAAIRADTESRLALLEDLMHSAHLTARKQR